MLFYLFIYLFCNIFFLLFTTKVNSAKCYKIEIFAAIRYQAKKQFYRMSGVRVVTVIDREKRAASVDRVRRSFFVTGACQHTKSNHFLFPICNRCRARLLFWSLWNLLLMIRPCQYNTNLSLVMISLSLPHLPWLVAWELRATTSDRQTVRHCANFYIDILLLYKTA